MPVLVVGPKFSKDQSWSPIINDLVRQASKPTLLRTKVLNRSITKIQGGNNEVLGTIVCMSEYLPKVKKGVEKIN